MIDTKGEFNTLLSDSETRQAIDQILLEIGKAVAAGTQNMLFMYQTAEGPIAVRCVADDASIFVSPCMSLIDEIQKTTEKLKRMN